MSAEVATMLMVRSVALTPKADDQGHKVRLQVFWPTKRFWTAADVADFHASAEGIAARLSKEEYWNRSGEISTNRFTCEDFALRVLIEYACAKHLPVKLTTGVRTYRNMELYQAATHDSFAANMYGFAEMVMISYGAPDMQRAGVNTIAVASPELLLAGDVLALAHDAKGTATGGTAHHIQMVAAVGAAEFSIYQGNSDSSIHRPITWIYRLMNKNVANPQDSSYAGTPIEQGRFVKTAKNGWTYTNSKTKKSYPDYLKNFEFFRWNFMEFNK